MDQRALAISRRSYGAETLVHRHRFRQIVLPERGHLMMTVDGERGAVGHRCLADVAPETEHHCWATAPTSCLVVDIHQRWPTTNARPFRDLDERLLALSRLISLELRIGAASDPLIVDALGTYLVAALRSSPSRVEGVETGEGERRRVAQRARDYIDAHLHDDLRLATIADAAGASVSHLQRCFRAAYDVSIVRYVQRARLENASRLLVASDHSITEIAAAVGFADASYFARLFRRAYGCRPVDVRRAR